MIPLPGSSEIPPSDSPARRTNAAATLLEEARPEESSFSKLISISLSEEGFNDIVNGFSYLSKMHQQGLEQIEKKIFFFKDRLEEIQVQQEFLEQKGKETQQILESLESRRSNLLKTNSQRQKIFTSWPIPRESPLLQPLSKRKSTEIPHSLIEENRLLAKIYDPVTFIIHKGPHLMQRYKGFTYYRENPVNILKFLESSNRFAVKDLSSIAYNVASNDELLFIPTVGNTYLARTSEGKYFPALIKELLEKSVNFHPVKKKFVVSTKCLIQWVESEEPPLEITFSNLKDLLPFGPDHFKAKLLEKDDAGYYYLKEKKQGESESSSKRAKTS